MRNLALSMIELIVTLTISAIIGAIAFASYTSVKIEQRRSEAQVELMKVKAIIEQKAIRDTTSIYTAAEALSKAKVKGQNLFPMATPNDYYDIDITLDSKNSTYTLTATPQSSSPQKSDSTCTSIGIDHIGTKLSNGGKSNLCW